MKNISYFIQQFLAKPTKTEARAYLGIGGGGDGDVTEDDLDFSDVTTANSDTSKHGLLPKLSGNPTDVLAGDGSWTPSVGGGDVTGPAGAVADNLVSFNGATGKLIKDSGIVPARVPTQAENDALVGTNGAPSGANPYVTDSDPRNTDDRDPNPHALSHQNGGGDEINVAGLSGQLADPQTPDLHASTHSNLGSDPVDVTDLAGYPGGGTTFLRDDGTFAAAGGAGTVTSVALTMPTAIFDVAGSPVTTNGTLAVTLDNQNANLVFSGPNSGGAAAPTFRTLVEADTTLSDITTNNATIAAHGYCPKLSNVATEFLNGTGTFSTPAGGSGITQAQALALQC